MFDPREPDLLIHFGQEEVLNYFLIAVCSPTITQRLVTQLLTINNQLESRVVVKFDSVRELQQFSDFGGISANWIKETNAS